VDYDVGGKGPLDPSFNFCVEVCDNSKLIASYYHHLVVQRRVSLYTLPSLYDSCCDSFVICSQVVSSRFSGVLIGLL
jgi:hypothetical protein